MNQVANFNLFLPTGDAKFGTFDYAIDSNSMFRVPQRMADIPLRTARGDTAFLGDVARVRDSHLIQMCKVRVDGRPEVYIPVYRQPGSSTLRVVDHLKNALPGMQSRLSRPDIDLKLVMDQSVYVRQSIRSLATEGVLGQAAGIRVRPVVMTALAALFALIPMALALERGSKANAPLGRAVIGSLIAGLFTTLAVVPALYSRVVRDGRRPEERWERGEERVTNSSLGHA